jgi:LEA14-like dessication related protein
MKRCIWFLLPFLFLTCKPKEDVQFKRVLNVRFETASNTPIIKADLVFYNPNKTRSKLKKIEVDILVNDKKAGTVNQVMDQRIEGMSEFTVPIQVNLSMKELGLFDTLINLFGGKKYAVRMIGKIKVSVHGISINVPVDYREELKLKM